jgi:hypothetical protein
VHGDDHRHRCPGRRPRRRARVGVEQHRRTVQRRGRDRRQSGRRRRVGDRDGRQLPRETQTVQVGGAGDPTRQGGTGGGGGGGAEEAAGGGGGSSFIATGATGTSSELSRNVDGAVTITPGDPGVGCPPVLQVQKVVDGPSTTGFTEHVDCTAPVVTSAATTVVANVDLPVNADGTPNGTNAPGGWSVVDGKWQAQDSSLVAATCTVTETANRGASTVAYACAWTPGTTDSVADVGCPGTSSGPSASPLSVTFEGNGDTGVLTVTNTFVAAAPLVVATPKFTG